MGGLHRSNKSSKIAKERKNRICNGGEREAELLKVIQVK